MARSRVGEGGGKLSAVAGCGCRRQISIAVKPRESGHGQALAQKLRGAGAVATGTIPGCS